MKNILFLFPIILLAGCQTQAPANQNPPRDEIVDQVFVPKEDLTEAQENKEEVSPTAQAEMVQDQVPLEPAPPYSVGELLDLEVPGSDFTIGQVLDDNAIYTRYYITYVSDGLKISGIMNVPKATTEDPGPWPVLFLNHGYIDTAVYTNGRGLKREQDYFARNGYVVIHSDYRDHAQSDKSTIREELGDRGYTKDILGGIAAFKSLNPEFAHVNQIGLLGHSMGGGVSMNALVARPESIQATVLYAPVSSDYQDNLLKWGLDRLTQEKLTQVQDVDGQWSAEKMAPYSAFTYFDRARSPVMIHHGDRDADVPIQWSKDTLKRLTEAGKEVIYHEYSGERHEFGPAWTTFMQRNVAFFDEHLKK